jgi:hypothetical protein
VVEKVSGYRSITLISISDGHTVAKQQASKRLREAKLRKQEKMDQLEVAQELLDNSGEDHGDVRLCLCFYLLHLILSFTRKLMRMSKIWETPFTHLSKSPSTLIHKLLNHYLETEKSPMQRTS